MESQLKQDLLECAKVIRENGYTHGSFSVFVEGGLTRRPGCIVGVIGYVSTDHLSMFGPGAGDVRAEKMALRVCKELDLDTPMGIYSATTSLAAWNNNLSGERRHRANGDAALTERVAKLFEDAAKAA